MKKQKAFFLNIFSVVKQTFNAFMDDRGLKLSAALAYYTIFSLAPMLIVLIAITGIFYGQDAMEGKVFGQLKGFIGSQSAAQIQDILKQMQLSGKSTFAVITGVVTLILGASGVFIEIQDSINMIWKVKATPKKGWLKLITNRVLSLSMIGSLGFLLIVSLVVNGLVDAFSSRLSRFLPDGTLILFDVVNLGVIFIVLVVLFSVIYKILPDVEMSWKDVRAGAMFTSLLFMLGKYIIGLYVQNSDIASVYGAAGSFLVVIVWVYYSAAILYFGAEFTQAWAIKAGSRIRPSKHAVYIEQTIRERDVAFLPHDDFKK